MRLLLVDDDLRLLGGLRRSLRVERPHWEVMAVAAGAEALALLEAGGFDVLVADMHMPGMDGATLLQRARVVAPGTVRLVLSGHAGRDLILACEGSCHQFLGKPLDPAEFIHILEGFDPGPARLETLRARTLVAGLERLPSLPSLHRDLAQLLGEARPSLAGICALVRQDLGMASKVLKLVNSTFSASSFAPRRKFLDLDQAVEMLSLDVLRSAVLVHGAVATAESLFPSGLDLEGLWEHSQAVAEACGFLARAETQDPAVEAFCHTAGLLHDLGILVLAGDPSLGYRDVLDLCAVTKSPMATVELDRFGTDHAEVGAELLHLWGLDPALCEVIRGHHVRKPDLGVFSLGRTLQLADLWSSNTLRGNPYSDGDEGMLAPAADPRS